MRKKKQGPPTQKGPPTKYDPERHPDYVKALAIEGLIHKEIAAKLGIAVSTFQEWIKKYPDLSEALKEGKEPADSKAEMCLFRRVCGYTYTERKVIDLSDGGTRIETTEKEVAPDVAACFIWLKNRRPDKWRDKQEIEHSGTVSWVDLVKDATTDQPEG